MSKQRKIIVDGVNITVGKFNVSSGLAILSRLQNMVGGSVFNLGGAIGADEKEQMAAVAEAIDSFVSRVPPSDLTGLITDVLTSGVVFVDGRVLQHVDELGALDADPYLVAITIFKEALLLNYGEFLKKLLGGLAGLTSGGRQE